MLKKLVSLCLVVASAALMSCGSDNTLVDPGSGGDGGGGGGGGGTVTVSMGSGIPPAFNAGTIAVAVPSLAAGGGTSLTVSLVDSAGNLYLENTTITFSSACIASSLATAPAVSTSTGVATTTYSATGCSGADVITASATVSSGVVSATGTVTVAASVVGSIQFISATPQKIGLQGTGGVGLPETSTVVFKVVDSTGGPVAGAGVTFALDTSVGGITNTPSSAVSGADGSVQTVVKSGSVTTSVRVSATVTGLGIGTQSSQLVITTGLPDQDSMSLSVSCNNVEGFDLDGTQADVTVRLADRYNNPVPDGTAVTFNTEGGRILGSCSTTTTSTESGLCAVTWTSSNPRPGNGRSTIMATAIGEESYVDIANNGIFDNADTWTDLPEAFRDDNESSTYDPGEFFLDFNQDLVRSPGDGQFNGLLCVGPGSPAGGCSPNEKLTVSSSNLIIMSGSTAKISDSTGGNNYGTGIPPVLAGGGTITYTIGDFRDQPLPAGTTITMQASSGITLGNPKAYTVPCTTVGPIQYSFSASAGTGQLTLTVEVPSGVQTIYFVAVTPAPP